jgi:hypothetical protein
MEQVTDFELEFLVDGEWLLVDSSGEDYTMMNKFDRLLREFNFSTGTMRVMEVVWERSRIISRSQVASVGVAR